MTNCTFSGNSGFIGGGMYESNSNSTVTNCTFSGNSAEFAGGGMYDSNSSSTVTNCILWGDSAPDGSEIYIDDSSMLFVAYSDIQGGEALVFVEPGGTLNWGDGNIDADPLFVDADGPDDILGTGDEDLRLLPGSRCVDAADNDAVPPDAADLDEDKDTDEPIPFDLDGNPRFVDDPCTDDSGNPDGVNPIVDMGAYEFQDGTTDCCPADFDGDGTVGASDLAQLLGSWGPYEPCLPFGPADFNENCEVNAADLAQLLGSWGPCP